MGPQLPEKVVSIGAAVFTGPGKIVRKRVAPGGDYRAHFPCPLWACHGRASLEGGHGDPLRFTSQYYWQGASLARASYRGCKIIKKSRIRKIFSDIIIVPRRLATRAAQGRPARCTRRQRARSAREKPGKPGPRPGLEKLPRRGRAGENFQEHEKTRGAGASREAENSNMKNGGWHQPSTPVLVRKFKHKSKTLEEF